MNKPLQGLQANQHLLATLKAANWPGALEPQVSYGFTLVELLLALGLGLLVAAWLIEALLAHGSLSAKLVDRLHQR